MTDTHSSDELTPRSHALTVTIEGDKGEGEGRKGKGLEEQGRGGVS